MDSNLTKSQIKLIFENRYKIKPISININNPPRKKKRFNTFEGYKLRYKKVIIKIPANKSISIFPKK